MVKPEVRKLISKARKEGVAVSEMERVLGISKRTIYGILQKERERGSVKTFEHQRGRKPALSAEMLEKLRALIESRPDITLEEMKEALGLGISIPALCRIVHRKLGFNYKKKRYTPANGIPKRTG